MCAAAQVREFDGADCSNVHRAVQRGFLRQHRRALGAELHRPVCRGVLLHSRIDGGYERGLHRGPLRQHDWAHDRRMLRRVPHRIFLPLCVHERDTSPLPPRLLLRGGFRRRDAVSWRHVRFKHESGDCRLLRALRRGPLLSHWRDRQRHEHLPTGQLLCYGVRRARGLPSGQLWRIKWAPLRLIVYPVRRRLLLPDWQHQHDGVPGGSLRLRSQCY